MTPDAVVLVSGARAGLPRLDFRLPAAMTPSQQPRRSRAAAIVGPSMYAIAIALAVYNEAFRRFEARTITPAAAFFTGRHDAVAAHTIVYFALGTPRAFGLQVTNECTSALLLIPLFVMMGSFATFTRISLHRQVVAVAVGTTLILVTNIVRVSGIAWATWRFGYDPGYTLSHVFVGSAFSLVGFVAAMLVALWMLVRAERAHPAGASWPTRTARLLRVSPRSGHEVVQSPSGRARPRPHGGRPRARPYGTRPRAVNARPLPHACPRLKVDVVRAGVTREQLSRSRQRPRPGPHPRPTT